MLLVLESKLQGGKLHGNVVLISKSTMPAGIYPQIDLKQFCGVQKVMTFNQSYICIWRRNVL